MKKKHRREIAVETREPAASDPPARDRSLLLVALALLVTSIAFLPVMNAGFVNLDDDDYVTKNASIRSFGNAWALLTEPVQGNYHPLTMASLALNHAVSGESAWSYHLLNLLLHLANTALVYRLASKLSRNNNLVSFTTALLFGVHPMHVESVAWVAERKDVLYAAFFLLGLSSYVDYVDLKSRPKYLWSLFWFVLSLASKPAAVIFPVVLFTLDFFRARKWSLQLLAEKLPFLVPALAAGWLTLHGQASIGATDTAQLHGAGARVLFACYGAMMYLAKLVAPVNLCAFYPAPAVNEPLPTAYELAPLVLVAVLAVCAATVQRQRSVTFGLAFFLVNLLLVLQLKIVGSAIIADRYTYVPYIGLFFLLGWSIDHWLKQRPAIAYASIAALGLILAFLSYRQAGTWKSGATLWDNAIEHAPSARAYLGRAKAHRAEGQLKEALVCYDKALELRQSDELYVGRANIHFDLAEDALALADYEKALSIRPNSAAALSGRGNLLARMGKFGPAITDLSRALQLDPGNKAAYRNRAFSLMKQNQFEPAIADYEQYLTYVPNDAEVHNAIGVCLQKLQQYEQSLPPFDAAIRWNPLPVYFLNRSYSWSALGKLPEAKQDAAQAAQKGLQLPEDYARSLGLR